MRHERKFGVGKPSLEHYPAWIKALIWFSVLAFGALFWWTVANMVLAAVLLRTLCRKAPFRIALYFPMPINCVRRNTLRSASEKKRNSERG